MYDHKNTIFFYGRKYSHFEFSNFYKSPIRILEKNWPSTEHYYQAMKFYPDYPEIVEQIRNVYWPWQAKQIAHRNLRKVKKNWKAIRLSVMEKALRAKFSQHKRLADILFWTKDKILVEFTKKDKFWGDGGNGSGRNELGKALMRLRNELKEKSLAKKMIHDHV